MAPVFKAFPTTAELDTGLARFVAARLEAAIAERGAASLVVSGGRTPLGFFARLAEQSLDWPAVSITLVDERWLGPEHADSNERVVRANLLRGPAAAARFVPLKNEAPSAAAGAPATAAALCAMPRPFDVVILGMGEDAHTASLFPGAAELAAGLDPDASAECLALTPPAAPHPRLSLTRAALLDSRCLVLHFTGQRKRSIYQQALGAGPVAAMPVRLALHQTKVDRKSVV